MSGEKRKRIGDRNDNSPKKLKTQWSQNFESDYSAKYSCIGKFEKRQFSEDFLKKAKSATYMSLTDQVKIVLVVVNTVLYFNTYMSQKPSESEKYTLER